MSDRDRIEKEMKTKWKQNEDEIKKKWKRIKKEMKKSPNKKGK
jgi:hypothetical protein